MGGQMDGVTLTGTGHEAAFRAPIAQIRDYEPGADAVQVAAATGIPFEQIVKLASNENDFPISRAVLQAIEGQFGLLHSYPWEDFARLKSAVAAANGVPASQVVLSAGSAQLVLNLPLLYADPGDEVILAPESYALYEAASQVMGARLLRGAAEGVPLRHPRHHRRVRSPHEDRLAVQPEQPDGDDRRRGRAARRSLRPSPRRRRSSSTRPIASSSSTTTTVTRATCSLPATATSSPCAASPRPTRSPASASATPWPTRRSASCWTASASPSC